MHYDAIIFDFDGVILESADIKTAAFIELFAEYPQHAEVIRRHHLDNVGVSRFEKFKWIYATLLREPLDEARSQELGRRFSDLALAKVLACPFVPGARELITALAERVPLYVVSGTPQEELDDIVDRRGLRPFFRRVLGTPPDKGTRLKALVAEEQLAPARSVYIGDGISDLKAARVAGIPFIARRTAALGDIWQGHDVPVADDLAGVASLIGVADGTRPKDHGEK